MLDLGLDAAPGVNEPAPPPGTPRRAAILALASVVTVGAFGLAFALGAAYFKVRRYGAHETRLQRLLAQSPTLDQVERGLEQDGSPLVAAPDGEDELRAAAASLGARKQEEILDKGRRFAHTRVFRAADMVYFIFFDARRTMRDFTCVSA